MRERLERFYRWPAVRERMAESCGGLAVEPDAFSARWLTGPSGGPVGPRSFSRLLEEGGPVWRSLADRQGTLVSMEVRYGAMPPAGPSGFVRLEPVFFAVREAFSRYGVRTLALMTAAGWQFVARVAEGCALHDALADVGEAPDGTAGEHLRAARAHDGAGRLVEFLAHEVARELAGATAVPVTFADVPPPGGGDWICLDTSVYARPWNEAAVRCAWSADERAGDGFFVLLPRRAEDVETLLGACGDPDRAAARAATGRALVPDLRSSDVRWAEDYRASQLARFHRAWSRTPFTSPRTVAEMLDGTPLPACIRAPLAASGARLMDPLWLRTVALGLWRMGWQPRAVAELIESGSDDARAGFFVRLLCGAAADGLPGECVLSCADQIARGGCPGGGCGFELERLAEATTSPV